MTSTRTAYLLKTGEQLGDYRVINPLGAGGMGEVYLVEHQHLRKQYALKILPADLAEDETFIDRFRIEARVMADLEHPGIVRVHNFGTDKGRYYLVMDYVCGSDGSPRTLDDELAWGNKLTENATLDIAIQLCDALEYAHSFPAGAIIHRDLKPGNILIHKPGTQTDTKHEMPADDSDAETRVKIADFGLARIIGSEYIRDVIDRSTHLTSVPLRKMSPDDQATEVNTSGATTVSLLGTYDYMSPEQKVGQDVGAQSDLYALGLILYRMLTGHKPEGTYEPPSGSGVNRRWDAVIGRCLKRNIEERYATAGEMKKDLEALKQPLYRSVPMVVAVPVLAVIVTAVLFLTFHKTSSPPIEKTRTPKERPVTPKQLTPGEVTIPFEFEVRPAGGKMTLRRGPDVIKRAMVLKKKSMTLKLKPGVYNVHIERDGYRSVDQQVAIAEDLPDQWAVNLVASFGTLRIRSREGQQVLFHDAAGKQVKHDAPEQKGAFLVYELPTGQYDAVVTLPKHEPASERVRINDARSTDLKVNLKPFPGTLRITSDIAVDVKERGRLLGRTGEWIKKITPGLHQIELKKNGYRKVTLEVDMPPMGEIEVAAPPLVEEFAELTVTANLQSRYSASEKTPKQGVLKVGDDEQRVVDLPWNSRINALGQTLRVSLEIEGFEPINPDTVRLNDGDAEDIIFWLRPLPAQVTIECNVPAEVYHLPSGKASSGFKKFIFGKDMPIGKTGEPITLDALIPQQLTIMAEGYRTTAIDLEAADPGEDVSMTVHLEPEDEPEP